VSNTPLQAVLEDTPPGHTIVFMIDLWDIAGKAPTTMNEVTWRAKQIQYASRTANHIDTVAAKLNLRHAVGLLADRRTPAREGVKAGVKTESPPAPTPPAATVDIVHLIYHPGPDQIPTSDAEFSRPSIAERRSAGYADMRAALAAAPWLHVTKPLVAKAMVHRFQGGRLAAVGGAEPSPEAEPVAASFATAD
jgi:NTE family protein